MRLRTLPLEDPVALRAYVETRLAQLDTTPRQRTWRRNALGMDKASAIASAPRYGRLDFHLTVEEIRVLRHCAKARNMNLRTWLRAALATVAVVLDRVDPADIPSLSAAGLLEPR